jgi:hypothetical protein
LAPFAGGTGLLSAGNTSDAFTLEVPPSSNTLLVTLNAEQHPNDFDLYVKYGAQASRSNFDCKSDFEGSLEGCIVNSPAAGTWHFLVDRFSGDGIYQITATTFNSASGPCVRDADTACLVNNRFEVDVDWQTTNDSGDAQVMSFGGQRSENNESAFFWFFSPTNFEMGLKILDACGLNNKFWVFISGLTNQGWTVRIRDTQTGATKTYSNPVGQLTATTADTAALACP